LYNFIAIHPAGLGDSLEDLILFKAILSRNKDLRIHYLCNHSFTEIIDLSNIDGLYLYPINKEKKINISNLIKIMSCPKNADLVYVFPGMNLKKIGPLKYLLQPRKFIGALMDYPIKNLKHIIPKNGVFDKVHYGISDYHRLELNKYYLSKYIKVNELDFNILDKNKIRDNRLINNYSLKENYIVIHIGSSHEYPIRSLGVMRWKQLIGEIINCYSSRIVFVGVIDDINIINSIISSLDNNKNNRLINLAGQTSLKQLVQIILLAKIIISTDSGPGQLAGIMKKKQIMLFGPTKHLFANPNNKNCLKVYRKYKCAPCYEMEEYYNCPYNNKCLDEISIHSIVKSIELVEEKSFMKTKINCDHIERCKEKRL